MKEAQQALLGSHVTPRRKRSPLPVPGQDLELHRMASDLGPPSASDDEEEDDEEDEDLDQTVVACDHLASAAPTPSKATIVSTSAAATTTAVVAAGAAAPGSAQRACGPRVHEPQEPAALVALSMSMMDDFEDVEANMSPTATVP